MKIVSKGEFLSNKKVCDILEHSETCDENTLEKVREYSKTSCSDEILVKLNRFELFPLEKIQLLNLNPKTLLDLQLCIEEMEERFELEQLNDILHLFNDG